MNNEPVAFVTGLNKFDPVMADTVLKVGTPLYTHPVKTLTDEEIRHLQAQCHLKDVGYDTFIMRFARAILKNPTLLNI